jgi:protein involved in polysaccharide export with SLBB domain
MVRNILFALCFLGGGFTLLSQQKQQVTIEKGTILTIDEPVADEYRYILFPRKNFIIKRGGIPNMKFVYGKKVEVVDYSYTADGDTRVTLKRTDGKKFFRSYKTVDAYLEDALTSGELTK